MSDHVIVATEVDSAYPYSASGKFFAQDTGVSLEQVTALSFVAAATSKIRLLTSVLVLPHRHPVLAAKMLATVDVLSKGRLTAGVGVGWMREEFDLLGQSFDARGRRTDEMMDVLRLIWGGGWVEHAGEFYAFDPLEMSPAPEAPIPIYVGGFSQPAIRRAASRGDGWISDLHSSDELAELIPEVLGLRAQSDRAGDPFEILVTCNDAFTLDHYRRIADMGATHFTTMPWLLYGADPDNLQQKLDGIARFGDEVIGRL